MFSFYSLLTIALSASAVFASPARRPQPRGIFDITKNELKNGKCGEIVFVWARGTFELGNMGSVIGPELVDAMSLHPKIRGKFITQGVDYPATVGGYFRNGDASDAQVMANHVALAQKQCPGSRVVIGGYSQGAQIVHKALAKVTKQMAACIEAVILFGDPNEGQTLPHNLGPDSMTICHDGDLICKKLPLPLIPHLTYLVDAAKAAQFIASKI